MSALTQAHQSLLQAKAKWSMSESTTPGMKDRQK